MVDGESGAGATFGLTHYFVTPNWSCVELDCDNNYNNFLNNFFGGSGNLYFFLYVSSNWVKISLHTENQLHKLPGSALKV